MIKRYYISVTPSCNLNCIYCLQGEHSCSPCVVNQMDFKKIVNLFPNEGIYEVVFYGGEPLLEFELIKQIAYSLKNKNSNIKLSVITNGTLLNVTTARQLNDLKMFVTLSHDGYYFERTRRIPDLLSKNPEPFLTLNDRAISGTVSRLTYDFYMIWDYFLEFQRKHGLAERVKCQIDVVKDCDGNLDERLLIKNMPEFERMLDKVFSNLELNIRRNLFDCYEYDQYFSMIKNLNYRINHSGEICAYCGADKVVCHMDIHGKLYPCHNMAIANGDIRVNGLQPGNYNPYTGTAKCLQCEAYIWCGGGCIAAHPSRKEYDCYANRQQFVRLIKVLNNLKEWGGLQCKK